MSKNNVCIIFTAVYTPNRRECLPGTPVRVPTVDQGHTVPASGYLASLSTGETGCGSTDTAWLIESGPGQTVVLTLYDFGTVRRLAETANLTTRLQHGAVNDQALQVIPIGVIITFLR